MPQSKSKYIYELYSYAASKWSHRHFITTDLWDYMYNTSLKCSLCDFPISTLQIEPTPIDVYVTGQCDQILTTLTPSPIAIIHNDLRNVIDDLLPSAVWGRVLHAESSETLEYSTMLVPRANWINDWRGKPRKGVFNKHRMCEGCGIILNPSWGTQAVCCESLGDHAMWVAQNMSLFALPSVVEDRNLLERFNDLRLFRIPVLEEPEDGYTLPEDPGWDGVLRHPPGLEL